MDKIMHGEPYVHLTWHESVLSNANVSGTSAIYHSYATKKRNALRKALGMDAKAAGEVITQVTGLYETIEKNGDGMTQALLSSGRAAANFAKASNPNAMKMLAKRIVNDKNWLEKTLSNMQGVLSQSQNFNDKLIEFFVSKSINPTSLSSRNINVKNLQTMDLEKKTGTSLKSLQRSLDTLKQINSQYQLPIEPQFVGQIDKLLSAGEHDKSVSNIIKGAGQRILNTQGFYLEALMWGLFEGAINDNLIKGLGKDVRVDLVGGANNKTDLALIKIGKDNERINIGFSMKAVQKGQVKKGYYGSSPMYRYYQMSKILDTQEEYYFNNMLAHNKTRSKVAQDMNKLIAARAAWESVSGAKGDEIYFYVYLNKIMTAEELYENMATGKDKGFQLQIPGVTHIQDMNIKDMDKGNSNMINALDRSHRVVEHIRSIQNVLMITKI